MVDGSESGSRQSAQPEAAETSHVGWMIVKGLWLAIVFTVAVFFVYRNADRVYELWTAIPRTHIFLSFASLLAAKFLLVQIAKTAGDRFCPPQRYAFYFSAYNTSQLAKYLPGGVWQLVGRAAIYKNAGFSLGAIRDAIVAESVWVIVGPAAATMALLAFAPKLVLSALPQPHPWTMILVIVLGVVCVCAAILTTRRMRSLLLRYMPGLSVLVHQFAIWLLLGASVYSLVSAWGVNDLSYFYVVGIYGACFLSRFLVPFAPAGIGVREIAMVAGFGPFIGVEGAFLVAVLHRLVFVLSELALAFVGGLLHRDRKSGGLIARETQTRRT